MCKMKKGIVFFMVLLAMTFVLPMSAKTEQVEAAYLNYTRVTVMQAGSVKVKMLGTSKKVKWSSSNKKIAVVSKKGNITGKKPGKCTVTAKVSGKKYKCKVTVKKNPTLISEKKKFTKITLNVLALKLDKAKVSYTNEGKPMISENCGTFKLQLLNTAKKPAWKTSNAGVVTVNNGTVTAVAPGTCTVSAVVSGKRYKCTVKVTDLNDAESISRQENIYSMLGLMNKARVKAKAAPLKIKEELNKVADIRSHEAKESFSHTRPNGTEYKTAYADAGFKQGRVLGENMAYTRDKVEYMGNFVNVSYKSLYKSKLHRKAMLNNDYEYVGIGYYNAGTYRDDYGALCVEAYWVQELYTK